GLRGPRELRVLEPEAARALDAGDVAEPHGDRWCGELAGGEPLERGVGAQLHDRQRLVHVVPRHGDVGCVRTSYRERVGTQQLVEEVAHRHRAHLTVAPWRSRSRRASGWRATRPTGTAARRSPFRCRCCRRRRRWSTPPARTTTSYVPRARCCTSSTSTCDGTRRSRVRWDWPARAPSSSPRSAPWPRTS